MTTALLDSENQPPVIIAKSRNWKKPINAIDNSKTPKLPFLNKKTTTEPPQSIKPAV